MYDLPIPEEPADGSVVLDREAKAWQRCDELAPRDAPERHWFRVAIVIATFLGPSPMAARSWGGLLLDRAPLAPMIAESAIDDYLQRYDPVQAAAPARTPEASTPLGCDSPSVTGEDPTEEQARPDWTTPEARALFDSPPPPVMRRPVADRPQA